jgi:hypothetical protein
MYSTDQEPSLLTAKSAAKRRQILPVRQADIARQTRRLKS